MPMAPTTLLSLPQEPLHHIAFLLCASTPLGPPAALLPLLRTCRTLYHVLTVPGPAAAAAHTPRILSPALQARIFRLKFDSAAVHRRLFPPRPSDLADQLLIACRLLRFLRAFATGQATCGLDCDDGDDDYGMAENHLSTALLMMLDNDGKNYAQLIHAGLPRFLTHYLQHHLWPPLPPAQPPANASGNAKDNDGWPADTPRNAAALWLSWLTTTRTALLAEPPHAREDAVSAVLPFVVLPQRYPAAYAPPNHFSLPLHPSDPAYQLPITLPLPSSSPSSSTTTQRRQYPHYPPTPSTSPSQPHFGALLRLTLPPASIPAKLLFVARRELRPAMIPPHLPPGPGGPGQGLTQADYRALNRAKAAVLPRGACWDWEAGVAREVNPRVGLGQEDMGVEGEGEGRVILDGDEESRRWDDTFWRMRLCGDWILTSSEEEEMFRPGEVYTPGSMSGLWQGKIYIPQGAQFNHVLQNPQYPSILSPEALLQLHALGPGPAPGPAAANVPPAQAAPAHAQGQVHRRGRGGGHVYGEEGEGPGTNPQLFSESSLHLVMQPLFLEMAEHHRVCLCAGEGAGPGSGEELDEENDEEDRDEDEDKGKVVPAPPLRARPRQPAKAKACGVIPAPKPVMVRLPRGARVPWSSTRAGASASAPVSAQLAVGGAEQEQEQGEQAQAQAQVEEQSDVVPVQLAQHHQQQPQNPQQQGAQQQREGAQDERTRTALVDFGMTNAWFEGAPGGVVVLPRAVHDSSPLSKRRRDEVLVATGFGRPDVRVRSGCVGVGGEEGTGTGTATGKTYVYETYDPTRVSSHDLHLSSSSASSSSLGKHDPNPDCTTCTRLARARKAQREREAEEARRVLEREMRRFAGTRARGEDLGGKGDEDEEMEDVDVAQFASAFVRSFEDAARADADADADNNLDPAELARFAAHTCAPGRVHHVRVRGPDSDSHSESDSDVDADLYEFGRKHKRGGGGGRVLGDDFPRGLDGAVAFECVGDHASSSASTATYTRTPYHPHPHKTTLISPIRREFERARVGASCTGVRDTLVTGSLPSPSSQHHFHSALYHDVTIYGRVRTWDGLVGMVRASRAGGGALDAMTYLFVCGYVVGGGSFVGEWRMAGADPLRPSWGGAVVMSKVEG